MRERAVLQNGVKGRNQIKKERKTKDGKWRKAEIKEKVKDE